MNSFSVVSWLIFSEKVGWMWVGLQVVVGQAIGHDEC